MSVVMANAGPLTAGAQEPPENPFSDEELTALALAADADPVIDEDAVPWSIAPAAVTAALPGWYMPQALATRCRGWRAWLVPAIVAAFLIVDAFGLCSTYG